MISKEHVELQRELDAFRRKELISLRSVTNAAILYSLSKHPEWEVAPAGNIFAGTIIFAESSECVEDNVQKMEEMRLAIHHFLQKYKIDNIIIPRWMTPDHGIKAPAVKFLLVKTI